VEAAIAELQDVYPANYNSPIQTVISGTRTAVDEAGAALKEAGAKRVIPLKVSGPFHTPLLQKASDRLADYLEDVEFKKPVKMLYSNVTGGAVSDPAEIRRNAALQITSPVRWTDEMRLIAGEDYGRCIECGPGKVLTGLWKRMDADFGCIQADNENEREKL
jgi:[acyl-carrier-protein] S-malonyltransferase